MPSTLAHDSVAGQDLHESAGTLADLDAYALALERLVSAMDRHAKGPLHGDLAQAVHEARELLIEDRGRLPSTCGELAAAGLACLHHRSAGRG